MANYLTSHIFYLNLRLMPKSESGIIHLGILLILFISIVTGVYLVTHPTVFQPKAAAPQQTFPEQTNENHPNSIEHIMNTSEYADQPKSLSIADPGPTAPDDMMKPPRTFLDFFRHRPKVASILILPINFSNSSANFTPQNSQEMESFVKIEGIETLRNYHPVAWDFNFMSFINSNQNAGLSINYVIATPPITVSDDGSDCSDQKSLDWSQQAEQAAKNLGYDVRGYKFVVYVFSKNNQCPWYISYNVRDLLNIGPDYYQGQLWLNSEDLLADNPTREYAFKQLLLHGLGHLLGLGHSQAIYCRGDSSSSNFEFNKDQCNSYSQEDRSDPLGNAKYNTVEDVTWPILPYLNAPKKVELGWLDQRYLYILDKVAATNRPPSGTYSFKLRPLYFWSDSYLTEGSAKVVKIFKPDTSFFSTTDNKWINSYYYIALVSASESGDQFFEIANNQRNSSHKYALSDDFTNGVTIYIGYDDPRYPTYLVGTTYNIIPTNHWQRRYEALSENKSFIDNLNGITIKTVSVDKTSNDVNSANIQVSIH